MTPDHDATPPLLRDATRPDDGTATDAWLVPFAGNRSARRGKLSR